MTEKEFQERIDLAEKRLIESTDDTYSFWCAIGVCMALGRSFPKCLDHTAMYERYIVAELFQSLFRPPGGRGIDGYIAFFLGERVIENLPRRLLFLRMFESVVLEEKQYLEWEA